MYFETGVFSGGGFFSY